jgi:hypothetical protein
MAVYTFGVGCVTDLLSSYPALLGNSRTAFVSSIRCASALGASLTNTDFLYNTGITRGNRY